MVKVGAMIKEATCLWLASIHASNSRARDMLNYGSALRHFSGDGV